MRTFKLGIKMVIVNTSTPKLQKPGKMPFVCAWKLYSELCQSSLPQEYNNDGLKASICKPLPEDHRVKVEFFGSWIVVLRTIR